MFELWNLEWFYFGDIETLIRGLCDQTRLIDELIAMEDPNDEIRSYHGGTPALITRIEGIANDRRSKPEIYDWTKPWPFEKLLIRRGVPEGEILVTPTMVVLPFPFPIKNYALRRSFEEHVVPKVIGNIPSFKQNELDAPVFCARSVLLVVDHLIKHEIERSLLETSPQRQEAIKAYEASRFDGPRSWDIFEIPEALEIHAERNLRSYQTCLRVDETMQMHFDIGIADPDADPAELVYEPHPGGAFDSECTEA